MSVCYYFLSLCFRLEIIEGQQIIFVNVQINIRKLLALRALGNYFDTILWSHIDSMSQKKLVFSISEIGLFT